MSLDLTKIEGIAKTYTVQELFAALVWSRRFNDFDGQEVITDLAAHPELWRSFLFTKPLFAPDKNGLGFSGFVEALIDLANSRNVVPPPGCRYIPYTADTLFVLTLNQVELVTQLVDFGKKWQADVVNVLTAPAQVPEDQETEDYWFQRFLLTRLNYYSDRYDDEKPTGAAIVSYW